jgi:ribonuclease HII
MICGVDEAGRGPVMGPLVIAGVQIENEQPLKDLNVRDSKKCTPQRREYLAEQIKKQAASYEVIIISAADIDHMRATMTLNELELHAFSKVMGKLKSDTYYVDSVDVNAERFGNEISRKLSFPSIIVSKHKADEIYPIVSAASILAKTVRDDKIQIISQQLGKKLNLSVGSGYPADPVTQKFLKTWVKKFGSLPPYTRHSWKTAQKILQENNTKKLDSF